MINASGLLPGVRCGAVTNRFVRNLLIFTIIGVRQSLAYSLA